ncbi:hypothetical protein KB553_06780 [Chryseobacterium rhizoplanae]|uniref:hypothetical protein n=1 Tax=Chryseobacterium rhizoplanae TaxID=1609531 RepID=UPI001CE292D5|nr:hypothetical protein [Chryseobacterium rhizoplanae]UCA61229.1 hypothetical protein KB553_06780 [Chryseobacterium rhizoplanae]
MRYIGFIKEYNNIPESFSLNSYRNQNGDNNEIENIINYLKNGNIALSWMGVFIDVENKNFIAPQIYYTDGEWIWPSYLVYYLEREKSFDLGKEFIDSLKRKKYIPKIILKEELSEIENTFSQKLEKYL